MELAAALFSAIISSNVFTFASATLEPALRDAALALAAGFFAPAPGTGFLPPTAGALILAAVAAAFGGGLRPVPTPAFVFTGALPR